jgi:hypothetical protein
MHLCGPQIASEGKLPRAPPWRSKLTTKRADSGIYGWSKRFFALPKWITTLSVKWWPFLARTK